jgi:hypothetical protein
MGLILMWSFTVTKRFNDYTGTLFIEHRNC